MNHSGVARPGDHGDRAQDGERRYHKMQKAGRETGPEQQYQEYGRRYDFRAALPQRGAMVTFRSPSMIMTSTLTRLWSLSRASSVMILPSAVAT